MIDHANRIQNLFENLQNITKELAIKEIGAMQNSQPPDDPTFIINQEEAKGKIVQKLRDCYEKNMFAHIFLTGKIGGGKTHFLNWINSSFNKQVDFYLAKFRLEETTQVKYNFIKMIVNELYKKYREDFYNSLKRTIDTYKDELGAENDKEIIKQRLIENLKISDSLASVLCALEDKKNEQINIALRILGSAHGRNELTKLKILPLTDRDYLHIIEFFLINKIKPGFLLIMLDEFEHAYLFLTPAARRNFFVSYKAFIDSAARFSTASLSLITATTEQYEGELKQKVSSSEQAIWSRIEPQVVALKEFNLGNDREFKTLFDELFKRYSIAHEYNLGKGGSFEIRKRLLAEEGSTKQISYRDAVTNIIGIFNEMRMNGKVFSLKTEPVEQNTITREQMEQGNEEYNNLLKSVMEKWESTYKNAKPARLKTSIELLFKNHDFNILDFPFRKPASGLFIESPQGEKKLIYIAIAGNSKDLSMKFKKCRDLRDDLLNETDLYFDTFFVFPKSFEIESFDIELKNFPHIKGIPLESEFSDLLALTDVQNNALKEKIEEKLINFINKIWTDSERV